MPVPPPPPAPPYGLPAVPTTPFPGLVALAGRSALGETRETVLACLVGARLALGTLPPYRLTPEQRRQRARDATTWLGALTLPGDARAALRALYEATARSPTPERTALAAAVRAVRAATASALDEPGAAELTRLADALAPADGDAPSTS